MTFEHIKTENRNTCPICRSKGENLYKSLSDGLFGVPDKWNIDKCPDLNCGLLWLNPMPVSNQLHKLYENYYTHTKRPKIRKNNLSRISENGKSAYLNRKFNYPHTSTIFSYFTGWVMSLSPKRRSNLDFSVFYLNSQNDGKLLEIGCGNGDMLINMQNKGWDVTGIEFDKRCVNLAKTQGLKILEGSLIEQKLETNSYDVIVMSHVIEHLPDPVATLEECNRLLKPSGKLVSITPNANGVNHHCYKEFSRLLEPPRHLHIFNINTKKRIANQAGFENYKVFTTIRDFSGHWWASKNLKEKKRFNMREPIPFIYKIQLSLFSFIGFFLIKFKIVEGDEIVLIASKE